ncbi:MAG: hypothetical protein JWP94_2946 [Mucilaginibacter sp.]|nr:hypothetical protein [Mucilaginibacter sp.]
MESKNYGYQNSTIEELLASKFKEVTEYVKISAQSVGSKNLPQLTSDNMRFYFEEFHLLHQQLIDTVGGIIPPETCVDQVLERNKITQNKQRDLHNKLITAKGNHIYTKAKHEGKSLPVSELRMIVCWAAILVVCLFDGLMAVPIFEASGFNLLESTGMAIMFSAALAVICHYSTKLIRLGKTVAQRRLIAGAILLMITLLFCFMANMRVHHLEYMVHANDNSSHEVFSPIPFIAFSVLFFSVGIIISFFSMPTKEERNYLRQYKQLLQDIKDSDATIASLERQKDAVQIENSELRNLNGSILIYGASLEDRIIHHAHSLYALWMNENLMYRSDNGKPSCFDQAYPFTFSTNFHSFKSMNYETLE